MDQEILALTPTGGAGDFILLLEMGESLGPAVQAARGYGHVAEWVPGAFDLERDFYPYPNAHFKAIVCRDLLETLTHDPMHMMDEIHRILRPGCHLILTTRVFSAEQIRGLMANCGLEVSEAASNGEGVVAAGRKVGHVRERYPKWLYPGR